MFKQSAFGRQFFTEAEIGESKSLIPQHISIEGGVIKGVKGLLIDGNLKNCHISTADQSPIFVSAMAQLEGCVIEGHELLIDGKFQGTLAIKGKEGEDVGGRLEYGSGAQVMGVAYISDNIMQAKGIKVVIDLAQRPFEKYVTTTPLNAPAQQIADHASAG